MRILLGLLAALIASVSTAQAAAPSVSASLNVAWTASTTGSNGTIPLTGANAVTSYEVFASSTPLTAVPTGTPLATVAAGATTATGTLTVASGSTLYVYVVACDTTGCSGLSAAATKTVPYPNTVPDIPTNVTVTLTITTG